MYVHMVRNITRKISEHKVFVWEVWLGFRGKRVGTLPFFLFIDSLFNAWVNALGSLCVCLMHVYFSFPFACVPICQRKVKRNVNVKSQKGFSSQIGLPTFVVSFLPSRKEIGRERKEESWRKEHSLPFHTHKNVYFN